MEPSSHNPLGSFDDLDKACDAFERAWKSGEAPDITLWLACDEPGTNASDDRLTRELVAIDLEQRWRRRIPLAGASKLPTADDYALLLLGDSETPLEEWVVAERDARLAAGESPMADLMGRYGDRPSLRAALEDAADAPTAHAPSPFHEGAGLHVRCPHCQIPIELAPDAELDSVACPSCGSAFSLVSDEPQPTRAAREVTRVGHFELVERVGLGAFGSVWKARDTELERTVAVKIPRKGQFDEKSQKAFLREAQNAAQLSHPGIVPVHEVGRDGGTLYIISEFVRGVTLADWLSSQQPTTREAAALCVSMADALEHAHANGVVHRDLKPANVLLDDYLRPRLTDFGLAKREAAEITVTIEGQVLGTPAYMSPEQARGDAKAADARSDVYSLGVILFQLLTGELPFRGNTRMLLHQVLNDEPPSPRQLSAQVSVDLETITLKCLEKDPSARYRSAGEVRDELQRWLDFEPIEARPISKVSRLWRVARRHPVAAASTTIGALALAAASVISTAFAISSQRDRVRAEEARLQAEDDRNVAVAATDAANESLLRSQELITDLRVAKSQQAFDNGDLSAGLLWSAAAWGGDPHAGDNDRIHRLRITAGLGQQLQLVGLGIESSGISRAAIDNDSRLAVTLTTRGIVSLWDIRRSRPVLRNLPHPEPAVSIAISADGSFAISGCADGRVRLWETKSGKARATLPHGNGLAWVAASHGNHLVASAGGPAGVILWDVEQQSEVARCQTARDYEYVAFSPDDSMLLVTSSSGTGSLLRATDGSVVGKPFPQATSTTHGYQHHPVFHPDSKRFISVRRSPDDTSHHSIALRNIDGTVDWEQGVYGEFSFQGFSQDGNTFIAGGYSAMELATDSGRVVRLFDTPRESKTAAPLPGGYVLTGSSGGLLQVWDDGNPPRVVGESRACHTARVCGISADRRHLLTAHLDGSVRLYSTADRMASVTTPAQERVIERARADGFVPIWNPGKFSAVVIRRGDELFLIRSDGLKTRVPIDGSVAGTPQFSRDGLRLFVPQPGSVEVWRTDTLRRIGKSGLPLPTKGSVLASNGTGTRVALVPRGSTDAVVFDVDSSDQLLRVPMPAVNDESGVPILTLSHAGNLLAARWYGYRQEAAVWDVDAGRRLCGIIGHRGHLNDFEFSPNDESALICSSDGTARLWNPRTGTPQGPVLLNQRFARQASLSRDGRVAVVATASEGLTMWDARSGKRIARWALQDLFRYNDDGRLIGRDYASPVLDEDAKVIEFRIGGSPRTIPIPDLHLDNDELNLLLDVVTGRRVDQSTQTVIDLPSNALSSRPDDYLRVLRRWREGGLN